MAQRVLKLRGISHVLLRWLHAQGDVLLRQLWPQLTERRGTGKESDSQKLDSRRLKLLCC